jgi:succinate dehydrogenase/fumarate reductase flavoprotein subunit
VFGRIAGEAAAQHAVTVLGHDETAVSRAREALAGNTGVPPPDETRAEVAAVLARAASVVRTDDRLTAALRGIEASRRGHMPDANRKALEARNAVTVAEMILRAALMRDESRGPHLRFPSADDIEPIPSRPSWERYIVIRRADDGSMALEARRPAPLPFEL